MGDESRRANGMDCLAAQVVSKLKDGVGHVYLTSFHNSGSYVYTLSIPCYPMMEHALPLDFKVTSYDDILYEGLFDDYLLDASLDTPLTNVREYNVNSTMSDESPLSRDKQRGVAKAIAAYRAWKPKR